MKIKRSKMLAVRELIGLSQSAMGTMLGVTHATVNRWELGKQKPSELYVEAYMLLDNALKEGVSDEKLKNLSASSIGRIRFFCKVRQATFEVKVKV